MPGIIGAYYASKGPIVSVIGDGSVMMNLRELETQGYNKIPAKIFIVNNNAYAVIRKGRLIYSACAQLVLIQAMGLVAQILVKLLMLLTLNI